VVRTLWLVVLVAACGKQGAKDPAPCDAVGAKVRAVANIELEAATGLPAATRHDAQLELGPLESEVAKTCRDHDWAVEVRACMVGATTGQAMKACAASLTEAQRGTVTRKVTP
jgi:hypothetical protein